MDTEVYGSAVVTVLSRDFILILSFHVRPYRETSFPRVFILKHINVFYQTCYVSKPCYSFGFHNFDNI
jgi:hypothetical protein